MKKVLLAAVLIAALAACRPGLFGQSYFTWKVIPNNTGTLGHIEWVDASGHTVGLKAQTMTSNGPVFALPKVDGSAGDCLTTDGSAVLSFGPCAGGLTPPITFSGSSASPILTVTQSGAGNALSVNGLATLSANSTSATVTAYNANTSGPALFLQPAVNPISFQRVASLNIGDTGGFIIRSLYTGGVQQQLNFLNSTAAIMLQLNAQSNVVSSFIPFNAGSTFNSSEVATFQANATFNTTSTFSGTATFNGSLSGTHAQNIGSGDAPAVAGLAVNGLATVSANSSSAALTAYNANSAGPALFLQPAVNGVTFQRITNLNIGDTGGFIIRSLVTPGVQQALNFVNSTGSTMFGMDAQTNAISGFVPVSFGSTFNVNGAASFGSTLSGTHIQNLGAGDTPGFGGLVVSTTGANISGGLNINGSTFSGTHAQNLGSGDSPTFAGGTFNGAPAFSAGLGTSSSSSSTIYIGSGNFYLRAISGTPSCSGVTNGWTALDTSTNTLWICSGGVATAH